ncbi:uncharacterized protein LOC124807808 [Hydra vulgaris]|uniref:uncharacterized protein LOC124807808 n=1 Tax=Hydra vulgaris TaxID=6087 RepID=UPI001F5E5F8E|nr:uncharacterized protein LOC124807808 [Hydra vulgaris]
MFKGLFFQDSQMQKMYERYPEILFVDATYQLLGLRMPIYLMIVIDGDGQSEIVALFILAEETKPIVTEVVQIFKKHNGYWKNTRVVMSDKDFTKREAFAVAFPAAMLLICLYHCLRSFRREITCEKMGITLADRNRCLKIIQKIAYSKSSIVYEQNKQMLLDTKLTAVTEYFVKNWDPIKHQWVTAYKDLYFNLGETTNNRLESMFNRLKSVCTKHTSMMQFFIEFFVFLGAIRNDRNHHHLMSLTRHDIAIPSHPDMILYREHLTPYAFSFVISQFEKIKNDSSFNFEKSDEIGNYNIKHSKFLIASKEFCNCRFMSKMELPCYHLFQLRKFLMLPMFDVQLVNRRWTKEYYNQSLRARNDTNITSSVEIVSEVNVKPVKALTQAQKYRNLLKISY